MEEAFVNLDIFTNISDSREYGNKKKLTPGLKEVETTVITRDLACFTRGKIITNSHFQVRCHGLSLAD
jgi:hypothetical protein